MPINHSPKDTEKTNNTNLLDTPTPNNGVRLNKRTALDMAYNEASADGNPMTLNDIMNELKANEAARKLDILVFRGEVSQQISGLQKSLEAMTNKVDDISVKVEGLETRTEIISTTANENRKMINQLKQDKLDKFMEIVGINKNIIDKDTDCKEMAIGIIKSFGINIDATEIEHAFKKEINSQKMEPGQDKRKILTVIFTNVSSKIRVMKTKRDIKSESNVYFNQALTLYNRNLIYKSKQIVGKKLKVYFARGCVRVLKNDKTEIAVDDESKLVNVQKYFDQINVQ